VPGKARSGHGALTRWWSRLRGASDGAPGPEEKTTPAARQGDVTGGPSPSLDEVLRDVASKRGGQERSEGGPTRS
jgi:hypothetical protein